MFTRSQKINLNQSNNITLNRRNLRKNPKDENWLHDIYLETYYQTFSKNISKSRSDVLLLGPSMSQLFKCGDSYQVLETATRLTLNSFNYVFFCVSDSVESNDPKQVQESNNNIKTNGCHWSLLLLNRFNKACYHFDSIKGLNHTQAKHLANNIAPCSEFFEIDTIQQSSSFECGVHVLVNTQLLLSKLARQDLDVFDPCTSYKKSTHKINLFKNQTNKLVGKNRKQNIATSSKIKCSNTSNRFEVLSTKLVLHEPFDRPFEEAHTKETYTQTEYTAPIVHEANNTDVILGLNELRKTVEILQADIKSIKDENDFQKVQKGCSKATQRTVSQKSFVIPTSNRYDILNSPEKEVSLTHSQLPAKRKNLFRSQTNYQQNIIPTDDKKSLAMNYSAGQGTKTKLPFDKVTVYADSHGRSLAQNIKERTIGTEVSGTCKPNAKLRSILPRVEEQNKSKSECIVFFGGTNDVLSDEGYKIQHTLAEAIGNYKNNILLVTLPHRHDLPKDHLTNKEITLINSKLHQLADQENNINVLNIDSLKRDMFTRNGFHLNKRGKEQLSLKIISSIEKMCLKVGTPERNVMRMNFQYKTYAESVKSPFCQAEKEDSEKELFKSNEVLNAPPAESNSKQHDEFSRGHFLGPTEILRINVR